MARTVGRYRAGGHRRSHRRDTTVLPAELADSKSQQKGRIWMSPEVMENLGKQRVPWRKDTFHLESGIGCPVRGS